MFRRRRRDPLEAGQEQAELPEEAVEDDAADGDEANPVDAGQEPPAGARYDRSSGPYDVTEVADDDEVPRLDLGGLRVPLTEGMELRLDVDEATSAVVSVTVVLDRSAVQLSAFAAPRVEGIWDEVRQEIASGVSGAGGTVDEVTGSFGAELHVAVPAQPGSTGALTPLRFAGVDGPRWFVRALFTDAASRGGPAAAALETVVRGCVVVRGSDPMAPGDALPLVPPAQVPPGLVATGPGADQSGPAGPAPDDAPQRPRLTPPRRGPEITEIR